jgi:hypothetical protein
LQGKLVKIKSIDNFNKGSNSENSFVVNITNVKAKTSNRSNCSKPEDIYYGKKQQKAEQPQLNQQTSSNSNLQGLKNSAESSINSTSELKLNFQAMSADKKQSDRIFHTPRLKDSHEKSYVKSIEEEVNENDEDQVKMETKE